MCNDWKFLMLILHIVCIQVQKFLIIILYIICVKIHKFLMSVLYIIYMYMFKHYRFVNIKSVYYIGFFLCEDQICDVDSVH